MTSSHEEPGCSGADARRPRKPYTLTKQRESWSTDEHDKFIQALQMFHRDWKRIESYVGSKTVVQIRSHAQKYFQKVVKTGAIDAIPPPRPKRKTADISNSEKRFKFTFPDDQSASPQTEDNQSTAETPNMALVYAFVGSMFDDNYCNIDHCQLINDMQDAECRAIILLLHRMMVQIPDESTVHDVHAPASEMRWTIGEEVSQSPMKGVTN